MFSVFWLISLLVEVSLHSFEQVEEKTALVPTYLFDGNIAFDAYLTEGETLRLVALSDRHSSIANIRIMEMNKSGRIIGDTEFICPSLDGDNRKQKHLFHYEPFWLSQDCFTLSVFNSNGEHWQPTCYFFSIETRKCLKQIQNASFNSSLSTLSPLQRFFSINIKQDHSALFVSEKDILSSKSIENEKFIWVSPEEIFIPNNSLMTSRGTILNVNYQLQPFPSIENVGQSLSSFQWDRFCGFFFSEYVLVRAEQGEWCTHSFLNDSEEWILRLASPLRFNNRRLHCTLLYQHRDESFRHLALCVEIQKKEATLDINIIQSKPFIMAGGCVSAYYFPAMQHFMLGGTHYGQSGIYCLEVNRN